MKPLDPALIAFLAEYQQTQDAHPNPSLDDIRQGYQDGYLAGSPRTDAIIATQDFDLPHGTSMRLYTPADQRNDTLILYFHGGGFALGSVAAYDNQSRWLAEQTGQRVMTVDYRLAPEHPFPAAPDDAKTAWQAVQDQALATADQIILAGDSAGGALSLVTALEACNQGKPPKKIVALYPATDMSSPRSLDSVTGSLADFATGHYLATEEMIWFRELYVPTLADATNWRASVKFADGLHRLPPTVIVSARRDPLFDQAERFHNVLKGLNVDAAHMVFDDVLHNFMEHFQISEASQRSALFVANALKV